MNSTHEQARAGSRLKSWLGRWLQPSGSRAIIAGMFILALILLTTLLVHHTGGTSFAWLHLMYLPIILAAAVFGVRGGALAALLAGLAIGPFMPMDVAAALPQTTSNWVFRIGFFLLVGGLSGIISNVLNDRIKRLQEAHRNLLETHEKLKGAQMQLIQTAKLESIGRLAAGVAHEVKNPLAVIQLGIDYLNLTTKDTANDDTEEALHQMVDAVHRADAVIKGLLNFSRSEPLTLAPAGLNPLIEESLLLVRHELSKNNITLEKSLAETLPPVALDQNKVKQVLINMFMNAIQSIGSEGRLSVKTFLLDAPSGKTAAPRVSVEIKDTGSGIPTDKLDKLFEPFFTTKPVGTGTGLGLSVSRNIIELHHGTIHIANRDDARGAVVTITFPVPA